VKRSLATFFRTLFSTICLIAGCAEKAFDWTGVKESLVRSLPEGTPAARATSVLDSLGFTIGTFGPRDSIMTARKREPVKNKLVFSTLRVVLRFDSSHRLVQRDVHEVFTGP